MVHLKRFFFTRLRRDKLDVKVEFPLENWDLSAYLPPHQVQFVGTQHLKCQWHQDKAWHLLYASQKRTRSVLSTTAVCAACKDLSGNRSQRVDETMGFDDLCICRVCLQCMTYMLSATTSAAWAVVTTMLTAKCQTASGTALMTAMCGLLTKARLSPPQPMFSSIGVSMKLS